MRRLTTPILLSALLLANCGSDSRDQSTDTGNPKPTDTRQTACEVAAAQARTGRRVVHGANNDPDWTNADEWRMAIEEVRGPLYRVAGDSRFIDDGLAYIDFQLSQADMWENVRAMLSSKPRPNDGEAIRATVSATEIPRVRFMEACEALGLDLTKD